MAGFERATVATAVDRFSEEPTRLLTLFGPRQTGKTTIIRQALIRTSLPSRYLAVDEPEPTSSGISSSVSLTPSLPLNQLRNAEWLTRQWEDARRLTVQSGTRLVLVFDEIQKIPNWSEVVKGLWDADRANSLTMHVVLLSSAPLAIQSGLSESLAGRFESIPVTHWSFPEMAAAFNFTLDQYVYFGGYPGAAGLVADEDRWRSYIQQSLIEPHLERDLLATTRVDKPALLKKVFELGASYSGQILSYNKMLGQLQDAGNTTTLARYLDLLSTAGLLTGLQKHSGSAQRRRGSSPKLAVRNTALMTAASGYTFAEAKADRTYWGRLVESSVGAHLLNSASSGMSVSYWRDGGSEVDFVLSRGRAIRAVEVKSGVGLANDFSLGEFEQRYSAAASLVVGERGIPLNEFLSTSADEWSRER